LDSASEIGVEWALFELEKSGLKSGNELIAKVLESYPAFFVNHLSYSDDIVRRLIELESFMNASNILKYMAENIDDADLKEGYMFDAGLYYEKAGDFDLAHTLNVAYLEQYGKTSKRSKIVVARDDAILFNVKGSDDELLKHYQYILSKYPNTEQSSKASELIARILLKQKKFEDVFNLFADVENEYKTIALNELISSALEKNDCKAVNTYLLQTSGFSLDSKERLKAFDCASRAGLHKIAKDLSTNMDRNAKTPNEKLEWLYRIANNLHILGEHKDALLAAKDAMNLAINQQKHYDIAFSLFGILDVLDVRSEAKSTLSFLDKYFGDDERIIPVYVRLLEYAVDEKDTTTIEVYAKKILDLQQRFKNDEYTPYIEFAYANALSQNQKFIQSLNILKILESKKLQAREKQRLFYAIASLYNMQNNIKNSRAYIKKCLNIDEQSQWRLLCEQASNIFDSQSNKDMASTPDSTNLQNLTNTP